MIAALFGALLLPISTVAADGPSPDEALIDAFNEANRTLWVTCVVIRRELHKWPASVEAIKDWEKKNKKNIVDWKKAATVEFKLGVEDSLVFFQRDRSGKPKIGLCVKPSADGGYTMIYTKDVARYFSEQ